MNLCLAASRPGHLGPHHHAREGERRGLQQTLHGLFGGDPDQEARGENQHLLSVRAVRFRRLGLHRGCHPRGWRADICAKPDTGCEGSERRPAPAVGLCHPTQCHLDRLWSLRAARYLPGFPVLGNPGGPGESIPWLPS